MNAASLASLQRNCNVNPDVLAFSISLSVIFIRYCILSQTWYFLMEWFSTEVLFCCRDFSSIHFAWENTPRAGSFISKRKRKLGKEEQGNKRTYLLVMDFRWIRLYLLSFRFQILFFKLIFRRKIRKEFITLQIWLAMSFGRRAAPASPAARPGGRHALAGEVRESAVLELHRLRRVACAKLSYIPTPSQNSVLWTFYLFKKLSSSKRPLDPWSLTIKKKKTNLICQIVKKPKHFEFLLTFGDTSSARKF